MLSYAGGSRPWKNSARFEPQKISDGNLEVLGLYTTDLVSSFKTLLGEILS